MMTSLTKTPVEGMDGSGGRGERGTWEAGRVAGSDMRRWALGVGRRGEGLAYGLGEARAGLDDDLGLVRQSPVQRRLEPEADTTCRHDVMMFRTESFWLADFLRD